MVQWTQASLPIKLGGLGIRRVVWLAFPAFLASAAGTRKTQASILGESFTDTDGVMETLSLSWSEESQSPIPEGDCARSSHSGMAPLTRKEATTLLADCSDEYHRAHLRAATAAHAGDWLLALLLSACGLRLDDEAIRIAACLRLGTRTCEPHICPCGGLVTADGSHGLSCGLGPGRFARHAYLNDIISRSLTLAGVPNIKEPPGISRTY